MPKVREERSGWRDEWISEWHRKVGWNAPFVDLDFFGVEYDQGNPVAIIDYKEKAALNKAEFGKTSMVAAGSLYTEHGKQIPFFVVFYWKDIPAFYVVPMNEAADAILPDAIDMSEKDYGVFMYKIRGYQTPPYKFLKTASKELPPNE